MFTARQILNAMPHNPEAFAVYLEFSKWAIARKAAPTVRQARRFLRENPGIVKRYTVAKAG